MSRPLKPCFHNTVKLQRKVESDGSTPELSRKTFTELLVTKMGFTAAEIWCIMSDAPKGTYLLTFMSESICRRYWQMCWSRRGEKPFSDFYLECQLVLEVKRMTVHVIRRHCTVTREPSHNLDTRACKEEAPCNLCGAVAHRFKDCPQRAKYYAQAAKPPGRAAQEEAAAASLPVPAPRKTKETGRRKGPGQEQVKPDQGFTPALEPQSTEEEMPAIPESGPTDNAPQPASEIQEEGPWTKQERRKRRHSPPQVTKKTRKKHLSNHNPNSDPEELEEEEQPGNEGPDDQLDQVTRVLQEMRALASVMEAPPPPSPATFEKEEASMEEEVQSLPVAPHRAARAERERRELFQRLRPQLVTSSTIMMGGDFNCILESGGRCGTRAGEGWMDDAAKLLAEMVVGADLLELYEEMEQEGVMPHTLREGTIALLYKHKGERCDLKNWRPISLLNVDYKILAKTMVYRLKGAMGEIVHPDQTCGVPGRRVADSLALIRDTIQYIRDQNIHAALVCLDQEKAFD
ncbi:hypothetical protein NDU88_007333 [Pleurodeles waltl]|uniref:Reverse transcriptase domain-containing protein n=1 Tax=Pleurodeles waltl TaxID=8319 RepID=A0AAV7SS77_PLEWA|nr:hypothetical protein NDU88_007333 [Pleurodeles waltl]